MTALKLYFDGGCRPNPGVMECAVVARGQVFVASDLGQGTSSEAEWCALLRALEVARALGVSDIILIGDSANVIAQAGGRTRSKAAACFKAEAGAFARVRLRWVKRSHNLAGFALERHRLGLLATATGEA